MHARKERPIEAGATKRCPFCSEEILGTAKKCKHCGEFLDGKHQKVEVKEPSLGKAALLSLLFPGLGQFYRGHTMAGFNFALLSVFMYYLFIPLGLLIHFLSIFGAWSR